MAAQPQMLDSSKVVNGSILNLIHDSKPHDLSTLEGAFDDLRDTSLSSSCSNSSSSSRSSANTSFSSPHSSRSSSASDTSSASDSTVVTLKQDFKEDATNPVSDADQSEDEVDVKIPNSSYLAETPTKKPFRSSHHPGSFIQDNTYPLQARLFNTLSVSLAYQFDQLFTQVDKNVSGLKVELEGLRSKVSYHIATNAQGNNQTLSESDSLSSDGVSNFPSCQNPLSNSNPPHPSASKDSQQTSTNDEPLESLSPEDSTPTNDSKFKLKGGVPKSQSQLQPLVLDFEKKVLQFEKFFDESMSSIKDKINDSRRILEYQQPESKNDASTSKPKSHEASAPATNVETSSAVDKEDKVSHSSAESDSEPDNKETAPIDAVKTTVPTFSATSEPFIPSSLSSTTVTPDPKDVASQDPNEGGNSGKALSRNSSKPWWTDELSYLRNEATLARGFVRMFGDEESIARAKDAINKYHRAIKSQRIQFCNEMERVSYMSEISKHGEEDSKSKLASQHANGQRTLPCTASSSPSAPSGLRNQIYANGSPSFASGMSGGPLTPISPLSPLEGFGTLAGGKQSRLNPIDSFHQLRQINARLNHLTQISRQLGSSQYNGVGYIPYNLHYPVDQYYQPAYPLHYNQGGATPRNYKNRNHNSHHRRRDGTNHQSQTFSSGSFRQQNSQNSQNSSLNPKQSSKSNNRNNNNNNNNSNNNGAKPNFSRNTQHTPQHRASNTTHSTGDKQKKGPNKKVEKALKAEQEQ